MKNKNELIKRYFVFFAGILSNALGVAFITRSMLGTGPTICLPYVIGERFPISFGLTTFLFNLILLCLQIFIRGKFNKIQLLQIPANLFFSLFIDIFMELTGFVKISYYLTAVFYVVLGCIFRAFGVSCQVVANVTMLSTEGFVKVISDRFKKEFALCKFLCDSFMVVTAAVLSFVFFDRLIGIREGTVITSFLVGPVSHYFSKKLSRMNHYFENEGRFIYETKLKLVEGKRLVITITSEAGSGGRVIARILGSILNIPVYDREFIDLVADKGKFSREFVKKHNERLYANFAEAFFAGNYNYENDNFEIYRKLYNTQSEIIKDIASSQDCIIVGHCANHVLKNYPGAIHFFIFTDKASRVLYISEKYRVNISRAYNKIKQQDNDTAEYYRHFTKKDWKSAVNYHFSIDSSLFGYEGTVKAIEDIVKKSYAEVPEVKINDLALKYHLKPDAD